METGTAAAPSCQFQFTQFDKLVEPEEHYNLFTEFTKQLPRNTNLHVEAYYAAHDVPEQDSSPSHAPTQGPGATALNPSSAPNSFIPLSNPRTGRTAALADISAAGCNRRGQRLAVAASRSGRQSADG